MIMRINRQNVVYIGANLAQGATLSNVQRTFAHRLAALHLPASVSVGPSSGGNEQQVSDTVSGWRCAAALGAAGLPADGRALQQLPHALHHHVRGFRSRSSGRSARSR